MFYYQFHIGDYIKHTTHLTLIEDAIYRRLLDMYYRSESPIPNDIPWVSRRLQAEQEMVKVILNEFFELTDDGYKNSRADEEIASYKRFLDKQKSNGIKGGRPKKPMGIPSLTQTEPKITLTKNQEPIRTATPKEKPKKAPAEVFPIPVRFEEFWITWPSSNRKIGKIACRDKWASKNLDALADKIISHVKVLKASKQWLEGFDPAPMTYINQSRWEDADALISADPWTKAGRKLL